MNTAQERERHTMSSAQSESEVREVRHLIERAIAHANRARQESARAHANYREAMALADAAEGRAERAFDDARNAVRAFREHATADERSTWLPQVWHRTIPTGAPHDE